MYRAVFSSRSLKALAKIPKKDQEHIKKAINLLEQNPRRLGVVKLVGFGAADYRLRVGNYRILFDIWEEKKVVMVLDIKRRTSTTY